MQSAALFTLDGLTRNQITHINHVAQLANLARSYRTFEKAFGLFVKQVETVPCPFQAEIRTDNAHIRAHDLAHLFRALRDEHHFFREARSFVVPFRNMLFIRERIDNAQAMFRRRIGIDHRLDQ